MDTKYGAYVGRFCPLHTGHCRVIETLLKEFGPQNSIVLIGSCSSPLTMRHMFKFKERQAFIKKVFPEIKTMGLPDFPNDNASWLHNLDNTLEHVGFDPKQTVFFGGCEEDVAFFLEDGRLCKFINRFDGSSPKISATEVRDCLIHDRDLTNLLPVQIIPDVRQIFVEKWEMLKKI